MTMPTLEQIAQWTEPPTTWQRAVIRFVVMIACMYPVVLLDDYFHSASPAAMFGYIWGGLSVYGVMRRH